MFENQYKSYNSRIEPGMELINRTKYKMYEVLNKSVSIKAGKYLRYGIIAVSMAIVLILITAIPRLLDNTSEFSIKLAKSSDGISASYVDKPVVISTSIERPYMSEETLINCELVFRGSIEDIKYVEIKYKNSVTYLALFSIKTHNVYKGYIKPEDTIKVISQRTYKNVEAAGRIAMDSVLSQAQAGMEGIFIARSVNEDSYMEIDDKRLFLQDIAPYAFQLAGECSAFLKGPDGLIFDKSFESLADNASLDQAEEYVLSFFKD